MNDGFTIQAVNTEKHMNDDFDAPNTLPGQCPECGLNADIWEAVKQEWHCCFCNWHGRNPTREDKNGTYN